MERLYNLGFFEDVNMKLLPGTKPHEVITEIDVVEQKPGLSLSVPVILNRTVW